MALNALPTLFTTLQLILFTFTNIFYSALNFYKNHTFLKIYFGTR